MSGNIETEVMIEIEGYENYYVTKDGNVWSERRKRYIEPNITNDNLVVSLCKNKVGKIFRVDHLVVKHWTEMKDENKNILVHINGDISDNNYTNLKWMEITDYLLEKYGKEKRWKLIDNEKIIGEYYISDHGDIWSRKTERLLSQYVHTNYYTVGIGYPLTNYLVHRLIADAFVDGYTEENKYIIHKDGNPLNNVYTNLEWSDLKGRKVIKSKTKDKVQKIVRPRNGKKIRGFEDFLATPDAKIYSIKNNTYLTQRLNVKDGYYRVNIHKKHYFVHRIIADTFLSQPQFDQTQVNHIDGNKSNNHVSNLEWCSPSDNMIHCAKMYSTNSNKKAVCQIDKDTGNVIREFSGVKDAMRITGVNSGSIVGVCKGRKKSAGGYVWKYL